MNLDPNNPVVRHCVAGVACESEHRFADALSLYMRAWNESSDDFERCISAHYVARHQKTVHGALEWNLQALARANAVEHARVREFYPSLYLNVGKSYEEAGDRRRAREFFGLALGKLEGLPSGPYRDVVKDGIQRGLERLGKNVDVAIPQSKD